MFDIRTNAFLLYHLENKIKKNPITCIEVSDAFLRSSYRFLVNKSLFLSEGQEKNGL
jgi:hypothetical protein